MRTRLPHGVLLGALALALGGLPASVAQADVGARIIRNCEFGTGSLSGFTQAEYNQALAELNGSAAEYSPCAQQIREAQVAALRGGGGVGGGPGSSTVLAAGGGVTIAGEGGGGGGGGSGTGASGGTPATGVPADLQPTNAQEALLQAARAGGDRLASIVTDRSARPATVSDGVGGASNSLPAPLLALLAALLAGGLLGLRGTVTRRVRARRAR